MPPKKLREGFLMRRSDIINLTIGVCWLGTTIWGIAVFKTNADANGTWIEENKNIPACVEKNKDWIDSHRHIADDVLRNKINVQHIVKSMDKLTEQLEKANQNFMRYNKKSELSGEPG